MQTSHLFQWLLCMTVALNCLIPHPLLLILAPSINCWWLFLPTVRKLPYFNGKCKNTSIFFNLVYKWHFFLYAILTLSTDVCVANSIQSNSLPLILSYNVYNVAYLVFHLSLKSDQILQKLSKIYLCFNNKLYKVFILF